MLELNYYSGMVGGGWWWSDKTKSILISTQFEVVVEDEVELVNIRFALQN